MSRKYDNWPNWVVYFNSLSLHSEIWSPQHVWRIHIGCIWIGNNSGNCRRPTATGNDHRNGGSTADDTARGDAARERGRNAVAADRPRTVAAGTPADVEPGTVEERISISAV